MPDVLNVAFWNVQNLFEPGAADRGPQSQAELSLKVDRLAGVINGLFGGSGPHLLGLAEVSDDNVLEQLRGRLNGSFIKVWEPARVSNETGLGLLASEDVVARVVLQDSYRGGQMRRPRCILTSCTLKRQTEPILVGVNHWKSRMGSPELAEIDRAETATWLGDQLARQRHERCAIVLGDFNAEPFERPFNERRLRSVRFYSSALWNRATPAYLYNTAWRFLAEPGFWEERNALGYLGPRSHTTHGTAIPVIFDQLLVSGRVLRDGPISLRERSVSYHCDSTTAMQKKSGRVVPCPWSYESGVGAGISDHLPLVATFDIRGGT